MTYLIEPDEPAGEAVQRVLREQNARILALLSQWQVSPADAIHRARQGCKRARAVAQLLKPAMPYAAIVENAFYRDIQKRVAYARDAEALVEALDYLEIGVTEPRLAESVAMLRESLAARAVRELEAHRTNLRDQIELACHLLGDADRRLAGLPSSDLRRRDLRRGADRKWQRCVAGFAALDAGSPAAGYHAWRRQVKYAANQTQLLAKLAPARALTIGPRLRELASLLGHAQDLELLEILLQEQPDALRIDTHVQRLRQLIAASLVQLRHRALQVGAELFGPEANSSVDALEPAVTEQQYARKGAATQAPDDPGSRPRRVIPDRDPHSSRRRQYR
ncbi:MAG: CHAD domain-containing protein [Chromatiales bacterium]|nr:CHAD domain-containing protein [Chromatiales bacterium]